MARQSLRTLRAIPDASRAESHPVGGWVATASSPTHTGWQSPPLSNPLRGGALGHIDRLSGPGGKGIRVIE
jgi:hypothetical protein